MAHMVFDGARQPAAILRGVCAIKSTLKFLQPISTPQMIRKSRTTSYERRRFDEWVESSEDKPYDTTAHDPRRKQLHGIEIKDKPKHGIDPGVPPRCGSACNRSKATACNRDVNVQVKVVIPRAARVPDKGSVEGDLIGGNDNDQRRIP